MSTTNSTIIERLQCSYLVPDDHPAPAEVRSRLDRVADRYIATECSNWLTQLLAPESPALWFIRALNVELSVDVSAMDDEALAATWGRQIALSIVRVVLDDANNQVDDMVRYFPDRVSYNAHFVADLAQGCAWNRWYYHPFDTVSSLPTSAAIRTVLTREPEQIPLLLRVLVTRKQLGAVLEQLSTYDAQIIYEQGFPADDTLADRRSLVEMLLSIWSSASLQLVGVQLATPHNALRLAAQLCEREPSVSGAREAIDSLLCCAELLRSVAQPAKLVGYLIADELTQVIQLLRDAAVMSARALASLSFLQQVARGDDTFMRRIASTVATSVQLQQGRASTERVGQSMTTLLGGIFLLLPSLLDLKLSEIIEDAPYPAHAEYQVPAVLRYLLFLKCFGSLHAQWAQIAYDPALLLSAGLAETSEAVAYLDQCATSEMSMLCQQRLMERLAWRNVIEGRYLLAELVEGSEDATGDAILLLRDIKNDSWVFASYVEQNVAAVYAVLMRGLALLQEAVDLPAEYLVLGSGFQPFSALGSSHFGAKQVIYTEQPSFPAVLSGYPPRQNDAGDGPIMLWTEAEHTLPQEIHTLLVRGIRRMQPAVKDLSYLTLCGQQRNALLTNRDLDLSWSLVARAVLRAFARRLIGFDQSSGQYLYDNFLAGTSTIFMQQDLLVVSLPCSPLHIILRMAGVNGQTYNVPWLDDMQVTLTLT